jgi:hypothetical protein
MSLCVRDIDFSSFYDFDGGMVIVVLHFTVSNLICCVDVVFLFVYFILSLETKNK